jgi:hypothetical protein
MTGEVSRAVHTSTATPIRYRPATRPPVRTRPRRRLSRTLLALTVAGQLAGGTIVGEALQVPGNDPVAAKLAEWGRDHGLNDVITGLEQVQYAGSQPAIGGEPIGGIPVADGAVPDPDPVEQTELPAPLPPLAGGKPLAREGQWQIVVAVNDRPAVMVASVRPDGKHTSFVVGVMRMDPELVRGELHPGTQDPGGRWHASTSLTAAARKGIAAVFNGGFKLSDPSDPGYYSEGRTVAPLVDGAASLVLHKDGTADVGAWNRDVRMTPDVASVRQNLQPLVDDGQVSPTCATGGQKQWGSTIGQQAYIHRSGFGVTGTGAMIYVGGPALSVCSLGRILQDAGVVRGMELDINPTWVSGAYFHILPNGKPKGFKLFPDERVDPQHYFSPSSRDWFAWYLRS